MARLPTGTVTFLFTDIEGSTRLVQHLGDARSEQIFANHRRLLRDAVEAAGGSVAEDQGESFLFVFQRARDAVLAAVTAQRALAGHPWPEGAAVRVRMGLHTGEPVSTTETYVGVDVHRVARICQAGHGGQVLLSQMTRGLVEEDLPGGVSLRDLGEHRLKDLARPQRLFQIVIPNLPTDFAPLKSLDVLPNNLPIQLTSFIGREREIAEAKRLLPGTRLLTLTGVGGVGKTRLALQIAAQVLDEFKDGVWLVELAPLSDPTLVPQTIASALGAREQPGRSIIATLIDFLQPKQLLLALDNAEHLIEACAQLADTALRACPNLRILATSREGLAIAGESTWRVPSLSLPDLQRLAPAEHLMEFEAIRLFVERAKAVFPAFKLTDQNAPAIARICHQLDGLPLAVELAAARANVLSVEQLADRLQDRFRLLTGRGRTTLSRHQTLQAAIDWSHDLLSEKEGILLRRLSVFASGWTLEGTEAICSSDGIEASDILDLLAQLVDKSLVMMETHRGEARYRLLETVRQYGREKLRASGDETAVRGRHRDWYAELGERARRHRWTREQAAWLDRIEVENDNLRAALEWSLREDPDMAARLAVALGWFWSIRGYLSEGRQRLETVLAQPASIPPSLRAEVLYWTARMMWEQGSADAAWSLFEESLAIFRAQGSAYWAASVLLEMGTLRRVQEDVEAAEPLYKECLEIARVLDARVLMGWALQGLGRIAMDQGDSARARARFEEGLPILRAQGDIRGVAHVLRGMAALARLRKDYAEARRLFVEALTYHREIGDRSGMGLTTHSLGHLARLEGDYATARALQRESLGIFRGIGSGTIVVCLEELASMAQAAGHPERAARLFGAIEAVRETIGSAAPASDKQEYGPDTIAMRAALGEESFATAWAEGRAMMLEQAVEYALTVEAS